jgi:hypothetical protein
MQVHTPEVMEFFAACYSNMCKSVTRHASLLRSHTALPGSSRHRVAASFERPHRSKKKLQDEQHAGGLRCTLDESVHAWPKPLHSRPGLHTQVCTQSWQAQQNTTPPAPWTGELTRRTVCWIHGRAYSGSDHVLALTYYIPAGLNRSNLLKLYTT